MANWTISFKTISGKNVKIEIGGAESETELTGSKSPIVISGDNDEDFFKPVRTQSARIKIVTDSSTYQSIMSATNPLQRPVTVTVGSSIVWKGFLACDACEQDWSKIRHEVTMNAVSPIKVLEGVYLDKEKHGMCTIGQLLKEISDGVDGAITSYGFPSRTPATDVIDYIVNRDNWISLREEEDVDGSWFDSTTLYDVLESICKVFGWMCQEHSTSVCFLSQDEACSYSYVLTSELESESPTVHPILLQNKNYSDLTWVGKDTKQSINKGKRSVKVTGKINNSEEDVFGLDFDSLNYTGWIPGYGLGSGVYLYEQSYSVNTDSEITVNSSSIVYNTALGKSDIHGASFEALWIRKSGEYLYNISMSDYITIAPRTLSTESANIAITISPRQPITTDSETKWLTIKTAGQLILNWADAMVEVNRAMMINLKIQFGDYWYDADNKEWTTTEKATVAYINEGGKIWINSDAYLAEDDHGPRSSDAYGCAIVKLPKNTTGRLIISIYEPWRTDVRGWTSDVKALCLSTLSVNVLQQITTGSNNNAEKDNVKQAYIGNGFTDDYEVTSDLTCGTNAQYGLSIVLKCVQVSSNAKIPISKATNSTATSQTDSITGQTITMYPGNMVDINPDTYKLVRLSTLDTSGDSPELSLCNRLKAYYCNDYIMSEGKVKGTNLMSLYSLLKEGTRNDCVIAQEFDVRNEEIKFTSIDTKR